MGQNSRRRRAGRQRRDDDGRRAGGGSGRARGPAGIFGAPWPETDERRDRRPDDAERAGVEVRAAVLRLSVGGAAADAGAEAQRVLDRARPAPEAVVQGVAADVLAETLAGVVAGGWGPADLVELVTRGAGPAHVPTLLTALHAEVRDNAARGQAWQSALAAHGPDPRWRLHTPARLGSALAVTALLLTAPLLRVDDPDLGLGQDASPEPAAGATHPKLARVRALLAKAESTTFPEEAEALSAKAQELIARYSLDELLARAAPGARGGAELATRRIWLDPPYLRAKSSLVQAVATANHARTAWCQRHGFAIVVGSRHDLDAVELLLTSLLVQADRAMLAHGRRSDWSGTSRTRSFRQAFLEAYAHRVGDRLREAGEAMAARDPGQFLPVLRSLDQQVREAFDAAVPHTTARARTVSNGEGWVAGLAAGDLADLGARRQVTDAG